MVGIDVAKATLEVAVPGRKTFDIDNAKPDIAKPDIAKADIAKADIAKADIAKLIKQLPEPGSVLVVLEATGGYENLLVSELVGDGHLVARVNPRQVRHFARALNVFAKTDRLDAQIILRFGQQLEPRTIETLCGAHLELQELVTRRRQLVAMRTMESNRKKQVTGKTALESIEKTIKTFEAQIELLDREIASRINSDDEWKAQAELLITVPGVGTVTAATLISELPELGKLNRQEIAALANAATRDDRGAAAPADRSSADCRS